MSFRWKPLVRIMTVASVGIIAAGLPPQTARAQAAPTVAELLLKGKSALNALKYPEADSLARRVLVQGAKLTSDQQVAALQLRAAALYPEETADQQQDSAIAVIRQLLQLGVKNIPKDMSHPGLDALILGLDHVNQPAKVWLGSNALGAILYIDDVSRGPIQRGHTMTIPSGNVVRISIKAEKCVTWDTTMVVRADSTIRVGYRPTNCTP